MPLPRYDLVILGSGSTAFAAALYAAEPEKTVVMTEQCTVGGTCANWGCLPHDAQRALNGRPIGSTGCFIESSRAPSSPWAWFLHRVE